MKRYRTRKCPKGQTEAELRQKELATESGTVWAAGGDTGRAQQLLQDRSGCHLHAHEGRPYAERATQTGLQPADQHTEAVHSQLLAPPDLHRLPDPGQPPRTT